MEQVNANRHSLSLVVHYHNFRRPSAVRDELRQKRTESAAYPGRQFGQIR
jgi:hypothetical protein